MSIFRFDYKNPSDLEPKMAQLTPGDAKFKILAIFETKKDGSPLTTMDGTPKITLSLSVTDCNGESALVYDDLTAKTAWKVKALLDALGLSELYDESGTLNPSDIAGGIGKCVIEVKKSEGYADRMVIKKYVKAGKQASIPKQHVAEDPNDDQIPF